jgi:hypothetical protein
LPDTFYSKRHDNGISPVMTFTPPQGIDWNLLEAGIKVEFVARKPGSPNPKMNALATVTGPWQIRYDPTTTDVDTIGAYDCEVEITRSTGKKITLPTRGYRSWVIEADLDDD